MKLKKAACIAVTMAITLTSVQQIFALEYGEEYANQPKGEYMQTFTDVNESHWAFKYIAQLFKDNVIGGYPDGKFYPDNTITRAEFAKIMLGASGITPKVPASSTFADVHTTDWFFPYVESAKEYLTGYSVSGQTLYLPSTNAIREDIAVALVKLKGYDVSIADISLLKTMFSDYESISSAAQPYVAVAVERGLISGYDNGTFRAQNSITRAEAAAMLWRASQYGNDNKVITGDVVTPQPVVNTPPAITAAPDNTATPAPTAATTEPTAAPATSSPEPTVSATTAPENKYSVNTIAEVPSELRWESWDVVWRNMTCDGKTIYFLSKGNIYKTDMNSGKTDLLLNFAENILPGADTNATQLFYDKSGGSIYLLTGELNQDHALYKLSGNKLELVKDNVTFWEIGCSMPNSKLFVCESGAYDSIYSVESDSLNQYANLGSNISNGSPTAYLDGNLYYQKYVGDDAIYKYDLKSESIFANNISGKMFDNGSQICTFNSEGITMYTENGKPGENIYFNKIDILDFTPINISNVIYASSDNIVFYDSNSCSFRAITK